MMMSFKQWEIKIKPRIKLNHNSYNNIVKGRGKQKGAEFSKVFQGFCLRLSEVAGNFRSMRKKCQIRLKHF